MLKIIIVTMIWSSVGITTDNMWMYIALRFVFLSADTCLLRAQRAQAGASVVSAAMILFPSYIFYA